MELGSPPHTPHHEDPVLDAEVEHAIAPYRALLPPEMLEVLRATIVQAYQEHPAGQRIMAHLRQSTQSLDESGTVAVGQRPDAEPEAFQPTASGIHRRSGR